jgi:hypothetical protein
MIELEHCALQTLCNLITDALVNEHIPVYADNDGTYGVTISVPAGPVGYYKDVPLYIRIETEQEYKSDKSG